MDEKRPTFDHVEQAKKMGVSFIVVRDKKTRIYYAVAHATTEEKVLVVAASTLRSLSKIKVLDEVYDKALKRWEECGHDWTTVEGVPGDPYTPPSPEKLKELQRSIPVVSPHITIEDIVENAKLESK